MLNAKCLMTMAKVLLLCGSPRQGNTEFVLKEIYNALDCEKNLILLREKNIKQCLGCLACDKTGKCAISDDMDDLRNELTGADIIVIGSPNYFDNVPGILKNFIDRTNPFYKPRPLKGKRAISIVVGGGSIENSKKVANQALDSFLSSNQLEIINSYFFQALERDEIETNPEHKKEINKIIKTINQTLH